MSIEVQPGQERAVELLGLHDRLDALDEELRVRKIVLVLTTLVSILLAVPLFAVLFVNEARFFIAYPTVFIIVLGTILAALTVERRRLRREQEEIRSQIRKAEAEHRGDSGTDT